ncbi:hypothetical protein Tco_0150159 [Tanacetum coccineum]
MHKVPIVAYYEDGLSLIATQIRRPIMLDAFTSEICVDPWGRHGFARALIEVSVEKELKQEVIMVVPNVDVFGHSSEHCPKRIVETVQATTDVSTDGFTTVTSRKKKGKAKEHGHDQPQKKIWSVKLPKPKNFAFQPKAIFES